MRRRNHRVQGGLTRSTPVPLAERPTELRNLALTAYSDDLTRHLEVSIEADALIDGAESGHLEGALAIDRPVAPDGSLDVRLDRITGRVTGRSVPSALLQGVLRGTPIVATRDIGPTIDIDATFSAGHQREVVVRALSKSMELDVSATVDPDGAVQTRQMR